METGMRKLAFLIAILPLSVVASSRATFVYDLPGNPGDRRRG
jgi:hypothetical protein